MLLRFGLKKLPLSFSYNVSKVTSLSLFRNYQNTTKGVLVAKNSLPFHRNENLLLRSLKSQHSVIQQRFAARKKKGPRTNTEDEESDTDSDDEDDSSDNADESLEGSIVKNVQSLRIDTVVKAGLGTTKKKIEKDFYANKIRINGEKVLKKARTVLVGDDIDIVKGQSPDNDKFILVDRIAVKSIGKVTSGGNIPLHMQVFKSLTIENYSEPWSSAGDD